MGLGIWVGVEEGAIETVFEDRSDRGDGAGLDSDAALAGGIDARLAVAFDQRQNAETGSKALFGMRPVFDDGLKKAAVAGPTFSPAAINPCGVHWPCRR